MREYLLAQLEKTRKDKEPLYDRIKDYEQILERGLYRSTDGVIALRAFKKGEVVYTLKGFLSPPGEGTYELEDGKHIYDVFAAAINKGKANIRRDKREFKATKDINENDIICL